jgi:hypothetical protein
VTRTLRLHDRPAQLRLLADCLRKALHKTAWTAVKPFPYGMWATGSGRQIIFDRNYRPLWQCSHGVVRTADPLEWVRDFSTASSSLTTGSVPIGNTRA